MFQTKVVEEIKTHILCSVTIFFDNRAFMTECECVCVCVCVCVYIYILEPGRQQTTNSKSRAHCMLEN